jgi:hypothetical protein
MVVLYWSCERSVVSVKTRRRAAPPGGAPLGQVGGQGMGAELGLAAGGGPDALAGRVAQAKAPGRLDLSLKPAKSGSTASILSRMAA